MTTKHTPGPNLAPPTPCADETLVHVTSPLGSHCGAFVFPTRALHYLRVHNSDRAFPYYLSWNVENDPTKPTISERLDS